MTVEQPTTGLSWSLRRHTIAGEKTTYRAPGVVKARVPVAVCDRGLQLYTIEELTRYGFPETDLKKDHPPCRRCARNLATKKENRS